MDMESEDAIRTMTDQLLYTLSLGKPSTLNLSEEEISCYLFEECEIGVITFFHDSCIEVLLKHGFIDKRAFDMIRNMRTVWLRLSDEKCTISEIRHSDEWRTLLEKMEDTYRYIVHK